MPSLTEGELSAAIKEGKVARAEKARALGAAVRERGYLTDDDLREVSVLRFIPFMNAVLKTAVVAPPPPQVSKPPLRLAALSACGVSAIATLIVTTGAVLGGLL